MAIYHSYLKLPEGNQLTVAMFCAGVKLDSLTTQVDKYVQKVLAETPANVEEVIIEKAIFCQSWNGAYQRVSRMGEIREIA